MNEENSTVAFIYKNKCHPVTQTYADAIGAVEYKITNPINAIWQGVTKPTDKYYFVESVMSMLFPITKRFLGNKVTIIFRCNDGLFGEKTTAYLGTKNPLKKWFLQFLIKHIDGISGEAKMQEKEALQWTKAPFEVCESYVENKQALEEIKPNLKTKTFLFIGEYRPPYDHKNVEFLLEVFRLLPKYKLIIIGRNTKQLQQKAAENVYIQDYVDAKEQYYQDATYYIHLPKYEAGPITLLEAISVGLIPIANDHAGHHTLVKRVDSNLIINAEATAEEAVKRIQEIEKMPLKEKEKISRTFKKLGRSHYGKEEMTEKFQETWQRLLQKID
jgi:glycosyltransferase involved in cell wall biosynthesis